MKYKVIFYEDSKNKCPVEEFIDSLDTKMRAKVFSYIEILEDKGSNLRPPFSELLDDGIYELRVKLGTNITRTLYFFTEGRKIILTNGFIKKTQKTPKKEIDLAKKRRADYLERIGNE